MKQKLTSTPEDLRQWLAERVGACDVSKFTGLTFQQAWKIADYDEREWAIRKLFNERVFIFEKFHGKDRPSYNPNCPGCNHGVFDPEIIGFYDVED
jgi:hypothetical protein